VNLGYALALFAGGLVAAPIAAYLVRIVPPKMLGSLVGGFIVLVNVRTLLREFDVVGGPAAVIYLAILAIWVSAIAWSVHTLRLERAAEAEVVRAEADADAELDVDLRDPALIAAAD
jgi:hypothetical protein